MTLTSTDADGPRLQVLPGKPHSPAPPSATTANGSLSSAGAGAAKSSTATATPASAAPLFILIPPYPEEPSIEQRARLRQARLNHLGMIFQHRRYSAIRLPG